MMKNILNKVFCFLKQICVRILLSLHVYITCNGSKEKEQLNTDDKEENHEK